MALQEALVEYNNLTIQQIHGVGELSCTIADLINQCDILKDIQSFASSTTGSV